MSENKTMQLGMIGLGRMGWVEREVGTDALVERAEIRPSPRSGFPGAGQPIGTPALTEPNREPARFSRGGSQPGGVIVWSSYSRPTVPLSA